MCQFFYESTLSKDVPVSESSDIKELKVKKKSARLIQIVVSLSEYLLNIFVWHKYIGIETAYASN